MTRAKGPFAIMKHQRLSWTEITVRVKHGSGTWAVLDVHDGPYDAAATAAFFGACEDLYDSLKGLLPLSSYVLGPLGEALKANSAITEDSRRATMQAVAAAFQRGADAVTKADTPVPNLPESPRASDPTYVQLVTAMGEIRRIVGGEPREADPTNPSTGALAVEDVNAVVTILDSLRPEALRE